MFIPPEGVYFRLVGRESGYKIYSRDDDPEPHLWHYGGPPYEDQLFSLIHGTGKRAGLYAIKGKVSGKVIFSRTAQTPYVGHIGGDGHYNDNWFKFVAGPSTGNHANHFRIWCPASGVAIFSRTTQKPEVGNYGPVANDQYFSFQFDNDANGLVVERIDFDVSQGKILGEVTMILGTQTVTNTSQNQTKEPTFSFSETAPASSNFEYRSGFPLDAGWVLKTGIPAVSNGVIMIDSTVNDRKFGTPDNNTKTYTASFKGKVGPGNKAIATLSVQRAMLEVPYTIHLKSKSGVRTETMGLWSGMSTWGLKHDVREEQI
ncbi:hypothetical protein K435DRAFT_653784 [Dendrothele bispora CBS 962.96]|uniref:Uncharacterized protein n=1 Tax=Dendrothele bispora (strain CBS 962.96) TaxID=1314807 RepID=A0A4S8MHK4_DENBC|nr:hypothetical protein K435DRAFT_653784 [Dendrothele bispora CBS 962.96]